MSSLHTTSRQVSQVESQGMVPNTPPQGASLLEPPRASYLEQTSEFASDSSPGSIALYSAGNTSPLLSQHEKQFNGAYRIQEHPTSQKRRIVTRPIFWVIAIIVVVIVAAAVVVPIYFFVIKPHSNSSTSSTGTGTGGSSGGGGGGSSSGNNLTTGGNGSVVTTSDGTTFTYINNFGGFCESSYFFHISVPLGCYCGVCDYFVEHFVVCDPSRRSRQSWRVRSNRSCCIS